MSRGAHLGNLDILYKVWIDASSRLHLSLEPKSTIELRYESHESCERGGAGRGVDELVEGDLAG